MAISRRSASERSCSHKHRVLRHHLVEVARRQLHHLGHARRAHRRRRDAAAQQRHLAEVAALAERAERRTSVLAAAHHLDLTDEDEIEPAAGRALLDDVRAAAEAARAKALGDGRALLGARPREERRRRQQRLTAAARDRSVRSVRATPGCAATSSSRSARRISSSSTGSMRLHRGVAPLIGQHRELAEERCPARARATSIAGLGDAHLSPRRSGSRRRRPRPRAAPSRRGRAAPPTGAPAAP